ncbi:major facilitator superfamily domain-containing protein [Protomyces lactucae-debilis]|uniref:Major facilitator superfamily domain-containing protein n=1 Tax=Protomyces lactucae-debilis TaxID=2754530 RepID=A0A1Y2FDS4_PROLT|nr:major facilitator superfamily domain-containing protein [Protomyces lactucae-debilis]ORY82070.1 major facilitator superfamily domain-containing protein [Protomyces lactucae-debilis]
MAKPFLFALRSNEKFIIFTCSIAVFTDLALYGILVPVLPFALETRYSIAADSVQLKVSGSLAAYAAGLLAFCGPVGWLSDKTSSRRPLFLLGLIALVAATLMLMLSRSFALLIAARILQGASAAVVWVVCLALLVDTVGHERIGQTMGIVSISLALALGISPLIGGALYEAAGYYSVYYFSFGLLALDIFLRLVMIEKPRINTTLQEPTEGQIIQPVARRKSRVPTLLKLLKYPRLLVGCWIGLVAAIIFTAFDTVLPLELLDLFGFDALQSGAMFCCLVLPTVIAAPIAGWWIDKRGPKIITLIGILLEIVFLVLLRLPNKTSPRTGQLVLFVVILCLNGLACNLFIPSSLVEIALVVEEEERRNPGQFGKGGAYAQAYALYNISFSLGTLIGPLAAAALRERYGFGTMCWVLSLFCVVSLPVTFLYCGGDWRTRMWSATRVAMEVPPETASSLATQVDVQLESKR